MRTLGFVSFALLVACSSDSLSNPGPRPMGPAADAGDPGPGADAGTIEEPLPGVVPPGMCTVEPAADAFAAPNKELQWGGAGLPFPGYEHCVSTPVVIDFMPDGPDDFIPEIVFVTYDRTATAGVLRVVSGRAPHETRMTLAGDGSGPVLADAMITPMLRWDAHPAAGDLDGDGAPEVVAVLRDGGAVAYRADGSELWRSMFPAAESDPNGSVAIADLNHDGGPEVIVGRTVVDGQTGVLRWIGARDMGFNGQGPLSCVADVVPGGSMEVIAGGTVYTADGAVVWEAASGDGFCAIGDLVDATGAAGRDGMPEVVRNAGGRLELLDGATGAVRWQIAVPGCIGDRGGAPTVADFDGDGRPEVGVAGSTCYAVFDRDCDADPLPAGCAQRGVLWRQTIEDTSSSVTSSTVFDFNGDGRAEVVYNDEEYFRVLDGITGEVLFQDPNPSRTRTEQPVIADVDNDGNAEIVFGGNYEADQSGDTLDPADRVPGLEIWGSADDTWSGARPIWNQHTYHIDNVGPTGVIPRDEAASWMTHDTYRLNLPDGAPLAAPDLLGTPLTPTCGDGTVRVCARIRNEGDVRMGPGVAVTFHDGNPAAGGTPIGTTHTTLPLSPRMGHEDVCIDWTPAPTEPRAVFVEVDAEGAARECVETNNVMSLGDVVCPAFG